MNAATIGAHLIGGAGLVLAHRDRVRVQAGVAANTAIKTGLTALVLAGTAHSGVLGAARPLPPRCSPKGATPATATPKPVATT